MNESLILLLVWIRKSQHNNHRKYRCSVPFHLFDMGLISYIFLYIRNFILVWHMLKRIINWFQEPNVQTNSVEILTIVSLSVRCTTLIKYPKYLSFLLFGGCQTNFPWSVINTTYLNSESILRTCRILRHKTYTDKLHPPAPHNSLIFWSFCSQAIILLFQVLSARWLMYCCMFVVKICRFEVLQILEINCSNKISRTGISMLKLSNMWRDRCCLRPWILK